MGDFLTSSTPCPLNRSSPVVCIFLEDGIICAATKEQSQQSIQVRSFPVTKFSEIINTEKIEDRHTLPLKTEENIMHIVDVFPLIYFSLLLKISFLNISVVQQCLLVASCFNDILVTLYSNCI